MNKATLMILLIAFLTGINAQASGYRCQSTCIAIDSEKAELTLLGSISNSGDLSRQELFQLLNQQCQSLARKWNISGNPSLVRAVSFSESKYSRTTISHERMTRVDFRHFFRLTKNEITEERNQQFSAWLDFDRANRSDAQGQTCEFDSTLDPGTAPEYSGDLPLQG